ncbi:MAG TPA: CpXC domain-containing protein [Rectinemataceae bacterium]|nr:CpXC domain-containing protein [Rectinemataceae bacterium]
MRKITCKCESSFEADLPEEIDLDSEPERVAQIIAGNFFAVTCPSCGTELKPELRVRLSSRKARLDLTVLPELERLSVYRGKASLPKGSEAIIGYAELIERARIIADGLDAESVEIIKYWLAAKAEEPAPEAEILVAYAGQEAGKLTFHVRGLKDGELAVLHVGRELYDKTLAEKARTLRSEPFERMFSGPYKSIRALEAELD